VSVWHRLRPCVKFGFTHASQTTSNSGDGTSQIRPVTLEVMPSSDQVITNYNGNPRSWLQFRADTYTRRGIRSFPITFTSQAAECAQIPSNAAMVPYITETAKTHRVSRALLDISLISERIQLLHAMSSNQDSNGLGRLSYQLARPNRRMTSQATESTTRRQGRVWSHEGVTVRSNRLTKSRCIVFVSSLSFKGGSTVDCTAYDACFCLGCSRSAITGSRAKRSCSDSVDKITISVITF